MIRSSQNIWLVLIELAVIVVGGLIAGGLQVRRSRKKGDRSDTPHE